MRTKLVNFSHASLLWLVSQMLSMRNGLSLHPICFPESLHPTLVPQPVISFDEGNEVLNSNRGQGTFARNQEISVHAAFDFPNQAPMTNINNSEASFGLEPSMQNHYGLFHHSSKVKIPSFERINPEFWSNSILSSYVGTLPRRWVITTAIRHELLREKLIIWCVFLTKMIVYLKGRYSVNMKMATKFDCSLL